MSVSNMIKGLMDSGMTQQAIAEAIGTSQPTIHRAAKGGAILYENGKAIERLYERTVIEPRQMLSAAGGINPKQAA